MNIGERAIEVAERNVALERDAGIARIRAGLGAMGAAICVACGEEIEASRRAALPSATRCVGCQARHERNRREI